MVLPDGAFILRLTDRCTEDAMKDDNAKLVRTNRVWLAEESCDLDEFRRIVERSVDGAVYSPRPKRQLRHQREPSAQRPVIRSRCSG
jgi:hypothetical protein